MAEFLSSTQHITSKIEAVISGAKEFVYLVSPHFSEVPESVMARLWEAIARNVKIMVIYRDATADEGGPLDTLQKRGVRFFFNAGLNTSIYLSEKEVVVSSLKLFEPETQNGIEFGTYFRKVYSAFLYEEVLSKTKQVQNEGERMVIDEGRLVSLDEAETRRQKNRELNAPVINPASVALNKKLSVKEKQKVISQLFSREFPDCKVLIEGQDRVRLYGKGIVLAMSNERVDIIFVRYTVFQSRMDEVKEFIKARHPDLKTGFQYNRINMNMETEGEIETIFPTIREAFASFSLIEA